MVLLAFACVLARIAVPAPAELDPSSAEVTEAATVVLAGPVNGDVRQTDVEALVRSFIAPHANVLEVGLPGPAMGLTSRARWASTLASEQGALGVFWVDLDDPAEAVLYLVTVGGDRVLARTIPRDAKNPAATGDAIGIIAGSIASALVGGAVIGMVEVEAPEPMPEPEPASEPAPVVPVPAVRVDVPPPVEPIALEPDWYRLRIDARYGGSSLADRTPWSSGFELGVAWRIRPIPYVSLGYRWGLPVRVEDSDVAFAIDRHGLRGALGARLEVSARLAVDMEAQASLDLQRSRPIRADSGIETVRETRSVVGTGAMARARVALGRGVEATFGVGVEVALNRFDYAVFGPSGRDVRLAPHLIRGQASLGLSYSVLRR